MSPAQPSTSPAGGDAPAGRFGPYPAALTEPEFAAFARALAARQARAIGGRLAVLAFAGVGGASAAGLALAAAAGALAPRAALAFGLAVFGAAAMAGWFFRRQVARAQIAAIAGLKGDAEARPPTRRIALDATGVTVETGRRRESHGWAAFVAAESLDGLLALWTPLAGFAIPARALGDAAAAQQVEAAARAWIDAARRETEARR